MTTVDGLLAPVDVADATVAPSRRTLGWRRLGGGSGTRYDARGWAGWLFALPALVMFLIFEFYPILKTVQYSFYNWDGLSAAIPVGLANYGRVFTEKELLASIIHSFILIIFFTLLPIIVALVVASIVREMKSKFFGGLARTLMFLPQIIPGAAAGVAWTWMYADNGVVNQFLRAIGLGSITRAWFGDFTFALPALGFVGTWLATGLCTLLLLAGIGKIDPTIYEAANLDGASRFAQFRSVTLPGLRQEIGVCVTITIISALASFDVVYMTTQGGPGYSTQVPGVQIYQLAFTENRVGQSSALAIVLSILVLLVILPIQRFFREK